MFGIDVALRVTAGFVTFIAVLIFCDARSITGQVDRYWRLFGFIVAVAGAAVALLG